MQKNTYTNERRAALKSLIGRANDFYVVVPGTDGQVVPTTKEYMNRTIDRTFDENEHAVIGISIGEVRVRAGWTNITVIINEINS